MHEFAKLGEATHFLEEMEKSLDKPTVFSHNLSAFMSAARSALQYAYEEVKPIATALKWFKSKKSTGRTITFFQIHRNINIHVMPIGRQTEVAVNLFDSISITEELEIRDSSTGEILYRSTPETTNAAPQNSEPKSQATIEYHFRDWSGSENALELSKEYLKAVQDVVAEGIARGFLLQPD